MSGESSGGGAKQGGRRRGRRSRSGSGKGQRGANKGVRQGGDKAQFIREAKARAEERFKRNPPPMAFPKETIEPQMFKIDWKVNPVLRAVEESVGNFVVRRGEYGWLGDDRMDEIAAFVKDKDISIDQSLSLRSAILQQKSVKTFGRLQGNAHKIRKLYDAGQGVVELSKKFDYPPMNTFRAILSARGWSKTRIKETLRDPKKKFGKRDLEQFNAAESSDRVANVDQGDTQLRADLFEDILGDFFEAKGVSIRRQPEMVKEQYKEHGRPVRTPDLLLLDHVVINGQQVAWIDAKHFYGADVDFQRRKTIKQMNRYIEEWGQGAIVFRHGFCANLRVPAVLLLDASQLDLSRMKNNPN